MTPASIGSALVAAGGYLLTRSPWVLVPALQGIALWPLARGFSRLARQQAQSAAVIATLREAAPVLSKASFDSAKVSEQAHKAAERTAAVARQAQRADESADAATTAVDSAAQASEQTQTAARGYGEVLADIAADPGKHHQPVQNALSCCRWLSWTAAVQPNRSGK